MNFSPVAPGKVQTLFSKHLWLPGYKLPLIVLLGQAVPSSSAVLPVLPSGLTFGVCWLMAQHNVVL